VPDGVGGASEDRLRSIEGFFSDVLFEIHAFMEDAGDFHGVVAQTVEKQVFAATKRPATRSEILPRFTAGKEWIGDHFVPRQAEKPEISVSLLQSPNFFRIPQYVEKVPFCEYG
jgi:hypothetical protein